MGFIIVDWFVDHINLLMSLWGKRNGKQATLANYSDNNWVLAMVAIVRNYNADKGRGKMSLNKCRCKGLGYIPFVKPDGTVSQYARQTCPDCGGYDHEVDYANANMPDRQPGDFDFACSYDWRSFYEEQSTGKLLEPIEPAHRGQEPKEVKVVVKHISTYDFASKRQVAKLYRIEEDVKSLGTQIKAMRIEKKKSDFY